MELFTGVRRLVGTARHLNFLKLSVVFQLNPDSEITYL